MCGQCAQAPSLRGAGSPVLPQRGPRAGGRGPGEVTLASASQVTNKGAQREPLKAAPAERHEGDGLSQDGTQPRAAPFEARAPERAAVTGS